MPFIIKKDSGIIPQVLTAILDDCINGVTLADPDLEDCPIIYANQAFVDLSGYSKPEIIGVNCRFLQGDDRNQDARRIIKEGLEKKEVFEVTLRNYKKDGTLFHNRLKIRPLFDSKGRLLYFLGVQYDITQLVDAENEIKRLSAMLK
jgi:PAS domain S-box-containing protein